MIIQAEWFFWSTWKIETKLFFAITTSIETSPSYLNRLWCTIFIWHVSKAMGSCTHCALQQPNVWPYMNDTETHTYPKCLVSMGIIIYLYLTNYTHAYGRDIHITNLIVISAYVTYFYSQKVTTVYPMPRLNNFRDRNWIFPGELSLCLGYWCHGDTLRRVHSSHGI